MDLKKLLAIVLLSTSINAYSIVPNDEYYVLAQNQINQLNVELKEAKLSLKLNPNNKITLELKSNIEEEIILIKQRIKLYKKLENSGSILY